MSNPIWYFVMKIGTKHRVMTSPPLPCVDVMRLGVPFHMMEKINCSYKDVIRHTDDKDLAQKYADKLNKEDERCE